MRFALIFSITMLLPLTVYGMESSTNDQKTIILQALMDCRDQQGSRNDFLMVIAMKLPSDPPKNIPSWPFLERF